MKKYIIVLLLLIGCMPTYSQSCEYCGDWIYSGFQYAGLVTVDCQAVSHDFENTNIHIKENSFRQTYSVDNRQKQIDGIDIIKVAADEYENAPSILVSKDGNVVQKLYIVAPDEIYILSDGCRFYFSREY